MRVPLSWTRRKNLGILLLPWIVAVSAILALKLWVLSREGFHELSIFLGHPGHLSLLEALALFRWDLALCCFAIPLVLLLLVAWLPPRFQEITVTLFSVTAFLLVALQTHIWASTGTFSSLRKASIVLQWVVHSRDFSFFLIKTRVFLFFVLLVVLICFAAYLARVFMRRNLGHFAILPYVLIALGAMLAVIASIPRVPATAWNESLLSSSSRALFRNGNSGEKYASASAENITQLLRSWRDLTRTPEMLATSWNGKGRGYNVIIVVLESMTAQSLNPATDQLDDLPVLRDLVPHSFLYSHHYTSYPETAYAVYSILTSVQAQCLVECTARDLVDHENTQLPGPLRTLHQAGYAMGYYGYVLHTPVEHDDALLQSFGFDRIVEPKIDARQDREGAEMFYGPIEYAEKHDHESLESLRQDIHGWTSAHQPFIAAWFPEVGHDPYRSPSNDPSQPPLVRGRALAVLQDKWLGELIEELRKDGALDKTLIVFTGDHGMRFLPTSSGGRESVSHGKLDDLVMHVPMLLYAPGILDHPVLIDRPTSHIDIMPTLLDLLGLPANSGIIQGLPMTDPRIANRLLPLPMSVFGASGYYDQGFYYMEGSSESVFKSTTLHFDDNNLLSFESDEANAIRLKIEEQEALQRAIVDRMQQKLPFSRPLK